MFVPHFFGFLPDMQFPGEGVVVDGAGGPIESLRAYSFSLSVAA
jgi:hypothetical protein